MKKLAEFLKQGKAAVSVILVETSGSTPQDAGSKMLVTAEGLAFGSIGGGEVEYLAIKQAQNMLDPHHSQHTQLLQWNLNKDIGMTCGGTVKLYFERVHRVPWAIAIFGAGHIANVLIPMLLHLECQITCFDSRKDWLEKLPTSSQLTCVHSENLAEHVCTISPKAFVLLMTQGHATDFPILKKFLETRQQPYLGVIGSPSKAHLLKRQLQDHGMAQEKCQNFTCPMGLPFGSNHPYEIALSISAQLIERRDQFFP